MKIKKKTVNYVNNADLVKAILEWQESCRVAGEKYCNLHGINNIRNANGKIKDEVQNAWPIIPDYIGKCIMQICNNLSHRYNFGNYTYRDEFVSDGLEACLKAVKSFDVTKTDKAFNYLTQVAYHSFVRRINIEGAQHALKHKNYQNHFLLAEIDGRMTEKLSNDVSNRIIDEYEKKITKSKILTKPDEPHKVKFKKHAKKEI